MPNITRGEFNHAIHGQYRTSYRCWYWNGRGDYLPNLIQFSSQLDNSDPNWELSLDATLQRFKDLKDLRGFYLGKALEEGMVTWAVTQV